MEKDEKFVIAFIGILISLFIAVVFDGIVKSIEWAKFSKEHNCVMTHKNR